VGGVSSHPSVIFYSCYLLILKIFFVLEMFPFVARITLSVMKHRLPPASSSRRYTSASSSSGVGHHHHHTTASFQKGMPSRSTACCGETRIESGRVKAPPRQEVPCVDCPICFEVLVLPVATVSCCGKVFCFFCIVHNSISSCPLCRSPLQSVNASTIARSSFTDLEVKIYGDKKKWESKLLRTARSVALLSTSSVSSAFWADSADGKSRCVDDSLQRACVAAIGAVKRQLAQMTTSPKDEPFSIQRSVNSFVALLTSLDTVVDLMLGAGGGSAEELSSGSFSHQAALRNLFSLVGSTVSGAAAAPGGGVPEQCAMFFAGGFMRRRAPSLMVISGDVSSEEDEQFVCPRRPSGASQPTPPLSGHNTADSKTDWRALLRSRVERHAATTSGPSIVPCAKLPLLIDVPDNDDDDASCSTGEPSNDKGRGAPRISQEDDVLLVHEVDEIESASCDLVVFQDKAHRRIVAAAAKQRKKSSAPPSSSLPRLLSRHTLLHRGSTQQRLSILPQQALHHQSYQRSALMSADTRVQSDLRHRIKLESLLAERNAKSKKE
jgi:hypothetical protein